MSRRRKKQRHAEECPRTRFIRLSVIFALSSATFLLLVSFLFLGTEPTIERQRVGLKFHGAGHNAPFILIMFFTGLMSILTVKDLKKSWKEYRQLREKGNAPSSQKGNR